MPIEIGVFDDDGAVGKRANEPPRVGRLAESIHRHADPEVRWALVDQLGKIRKRTRLGRTTYYLDFRPYGRVWAHRGVSMTDEATARQVLRKIQAKVAEGRELSAVLTDYVGDARPGQVNTWVARWLEHVQGQVEDGQRSPTYLAALRSYARDEGPFSWWQGWSVHDVKKPALVTWRDWMLRKREPRLSPKSVQNVLGAFRAFMRWLVDEPEVLQKLPVFPTVEVDEYILTIITPETSARSTSRTTGTAGSPSTRPPRVTRPAPPSAGPRRAGHGATRFPRSCRSGWPSGCGARTT